MATVLVASTQIPAHTLNATRLVLGLVARGHEVLWYADRRYADHVVRCRATHLAPSATVPGPAGGVGLSGLRQMYRDQVVGSGRAQLADLFRLVGDRRVDAVLSDTLIPAAGLEASRRGVPWVTFGDGPLLWWDEDTPPFGTGLAPMAGEHGRGRNRRVQRVIDRVVYAPAVAEANVLRAGAGLPAVSTLREAQLSPQLHLQGCSPGFEYPRRPWPAQVHFIGALGPGPGFAPPLPERLRRGVRSRPLALVTQGTLRPDPEELARPAAKALVAEGFEVVVAGLTDFGWNPHPGRVTVRVVDYYDALAEADLFVTNGGYTGVTLAVAAGVPVLQAGASEEKPDIGARVVWSEVGGAIRLTRPPAWLLRRMVRTMMESVRRREASRRLHDESLAYDADRLGPRLIEGVLA